MESYGEYISPIVGDNKELANKLTTGLDEILRKELPTFTVLPKENGHPEQQEQPDYNFILGPVLSDGLRYTTAQILEMPHIHFFEKYHNTATTETKSAMGNFIFNIVGSGLGPFEESLGMERYRIKLKEIIAISPDEALKIKGIGEKMINKVNQYFQQNYGISLGTKLG